MKNVTKTLAFVSYNLSPGGAERVVTTLVNELCAKYEVLLITLTPCKSFYPLDERVKLHDCKLTDEGSNLQRLPLYFKTLRRLGSLLKSNQVDVVIGFTTTVNIFTIMAAKSAKSKCIISERNNPFVRIPNLFWKTLRNFNYKKADALVVQTNASVSFFKELLSTKKIHVLPNPLSQEIATKRSLPKKIGQFKTILNVGRLDKNKAQDVLIKAFANVAAKDWKLQLLGDGSLKENYRKLAENLDIQEQVEFLGNKKNVWDFYTDAEIFAFTSKSEGFPNALTEALYFGLPCISTNCPNGPSELIDDGKNGFLIPVDGQEELENKLALLINDVNLRRRLSKEAIKRAAAYETGQIVHMWERLIREVSKT